MSRVGAKQQVDSREQIFNPNSRSTAMQMKPRRQPVNALRRKEFRFALQPKTVAAFRSFVIMKFEHGNYIPINSTCRDSGLLEQCDAPKSRIYGFLMVSFLAATSVIAGVRRLRRLKPKPVHSPARPVPNPDRRADLAFRRFPGTKRRIQAAKACTPTLEL